ncbi:hypothetical protein [Heyndrickxia oleronia]|uniref:hypothetical protein n=1 Tax=Heyndrickxia oleronia TaxID=38875 RepID=UPI001C0EED03|nr:hypothetical protein [Heyndrickxia oleronia]MBU5214542.1 hypothetical protein [Heyndrickxia oleronia]
MKNKLLLALVLISVIFAGCQRYSGGEPVNKEDNQPKEEVKKENKNQKEDKKQVVKNEDESDSIDKYLTDSVDPLINSVSSNIDTNWQFYMVEPIDRLLKDNDLEKFKNDVGLLINLYSGVVSQVNELQIPNYLNNDQKKDVEEIKLGLKEAINKRIEFADTLHSAANKEIIINQDIENIIDESNKNLNSAVSAYKNLINKK